MSRNPSVDWPTIHREYVYSEPPISFTDLAAKHGIARSGLAAKAAGEEGEISWFEEREAFRATVNHNVSLALAGEFAQFELANRRKIADAAAKTLDAYMKGLADGEIKVGPREAAVWVDVMRQVFEDAARARVSDPDVIEGDEMTEAAARAAIIEAERMLDAGNTER